MADLTLLRKIQKGLISYVLKGELVDEKNSANIGNGAYGTIRKIKYCGTPCAAKEMRSDLLPELLAGMLQKDNSESLIVERFCAEIKTLIVKFVTQILFISLECTLKKVLLFQY